MQTKEIELHNRIQFWTLLGPFVGVAVLFVMLVKLSFGPLFIPIGALIGIPICSRWKVRGLAISLGILAVAVAYHYGAIPVQDRFWYMGMALAVALTFVVTALSYEEVGGMIQRLQLESKSRFDNLLILDEKRAQLVAERDRFREVAELSKEEFLAAHRDRAKLEEELAEMSRKLAKLEEELHDSRSTIDLLTKPAM